MANIEAWMVQESTDQAPPLAAEAQAYSFHERPDGTAMYATDVVDAIKRGCTGLADMDPQEADALFQLAAQPTEAPVEPRAEKPQASPSADKQKTESNKPQPTQPEKVVTEPEVVEQQYGVVPPVMEQRRAQAHAPQALEREKTALEVKKTEHIVVTKKPQPKIVPMVQPATPKRPDRPQPPKFKDMKPPVVPEKLLAEDVLDVPVLSSSTPESVVTTNEPTVIPSVLPRETFVFDSPEPVLEAEVVDSSAFPEQIPDAVQEAEVVVKEFKTLVASQLATNEAPLPLEAIQKQANEQPVEQTLAQLASTLQASKMPELESLVEILQEIEKVRPIGRAVSEDVAVELAPVITEKILLLLSKLGYAHPEEVLQEFVRLHGSATLLQILAYLYTLSNDDAMHERLTVSALHIALGDDTVRVRVGKLLFGLIIKFVIPAAAS